MATSEPRVSLTSVALCFRQSHPEFRESVLKAYYAYHAEHFRCVPQGHNFLNGSRESACSWCGRTREQVRWDELPPECADRPPMPDIEDTILSEEKKMWLLLDRAEKEVPALVAKHGMSGETLAMLYHTYGYDPETVASVVTVPPQMLAGYHAAMELERDRSRAAQVKVVVRVAENPVSKSEKDNS